MILTDCFTIVDAASIEEVRVLAAGANVAHGKGNTEADYHNIIERLMKLGDTYMDNCFEADVNKIADAIGAARPKVRAGYSNYFPYNGQSLSQICVEKRDAAIREQHKAGLSNRAIARLFKMNPNNGHNVVKAILDKEVVENGDSPKSTSKSSPVLPLANTEDRSDIRQDSSALDGAITAYCSFDDAEGDDYVPFDIDEDDEDEAPFDVLAVTGYGEGTAPESDLSMCREEECGDHGEA